MAGSGPSFCVRSCDGKYFPLTMRGNASPVQTCQAFCPASVTKVYYGSNIDGATASNGERYADSENAFAYRKALRADCTCNGRDPTGLAPVDLTLDTSLRSGDVIATSDGLVAYTGVRLGANQTPDFTPVASYPGLTAEVRARLGEMKVAPVNAEMAGEIRDAGSEPRGGATCIDGAEDDCAKGDAGGSELNYRPTMTPITFGADRYFSSMLARAAARFSGVSRSALFGQYHPAIAPPVRQHALIVDEVVALLGGEDARMRFIERIEPGVIRKREQIVAEIVGGVAPHRHADGVEFAVDGVVVDDLTARGLMQPRQRAREIGDAGESELIEGDSGHVVLASSDRP